MRVPDPLVRRCSFAIGVLTRSPDADPALLPDERLAVAIAAYHCGYFLLDILEVPISDEITDRSGAAVDASWAHVWSLAELSSPNSVVVRGHVDQGRLDALTDKLRMVVHRADGPVPVVAEQTAEE